MDRETRKRDFKTSAEIYWTPAGESGEDLGEEIWSRGERTGQNSQAAVCLASCSSSGKEAGVAGAVGSGRGAGSSKVLKVREVSAVAMFGWETWKS